MKTLSELRDRITTYHPVAWRIFMTIAFGAIVILTGRGFLYIWHGVFVMMAWLVVLIWLNFGEEYN